MMTDSQRKELARKIQKCLAAVTDQASFIQELLAVTLDWPIPLDGDVVTIDQLGYEHAPHGRKTPQTDRKILDIVEVNLIGPQQHWGVFILKFKDRDVFDADRGMTGVLRELLRDLVPNRRKDPSRRSWNRDHLLFICTHDFEQFRFAYFKKPLEEKTQPRLAAFGWEAGSSAVRTVCEFNLSHLSWPADPAKKDDWVSQWAAAFDVERVTKKFYTDYAAEDKRLRIAVAPLLKEKNIDAEPVKMFVQTLLNRLMFIRFIERKGWLTPPNGGEKRSYLRELFSKPDYRGKSFYAGRVRKLFFEGLAVDGKQESESIGKVVFLNGGLFEETKLDEKVTDIPNDAFVSLLGPDGLFYRFNFTVQESTPLDVEVAVDPEMLGKVFEELVTGRHESGSYYTPRPVVSFMCREALKGYLTVALSPSPGTPGEGRGEGSLAASSGGEGSSSREKLEATVAAFVDRHDTTGIDIPVAGRLVHALDHLKAVDPACGSGAYLLGLLHEMVDLYRLLYHPDLLNDSTKEHDLKLRIISNSIYGVDIDKFATNIAMLRLWLSLSVDSKKPLPLPNLEFKIETGDSLGGPCKTFGETFREMSLYDLARKTIKLKEEHIAEHTPRKHKIKNEIDETRAAVRREVRKNEGADNAIDWFAFFPEVFAEKRTDLTIDGQFALVNQIRGRQTSLTTAPERGGFDIVLANPPYVRQESIVSQKPTLKKMFPDTYAGTADLYTYFYARALQCLRLGGMLAFISSNKWFRAGYGQKLRAHISKTATVKIILDFHDLPVFESAIAYPMIFLAQNKAAAGASAAVLAEPPTLLAPYPDVTAVVAKYGYSLPDTALGTDGTWQLATSTIADRITKMRAAGRSLGKYVGGRIYYGVKTGLNEAWIDGKGKVYVKGDKRPRDAEHCGVFIINNEERTTIITADKKSRDIIKPMVMGKDIKRWRVDSRAKWLIFTRRGIDIDAYPGVRDHLAQFRRDLTPKKPGDAAEKRGRKPGSYKWYEVQDEIAYFAEFEGSKLILPDISPEPRFALADPGVFSGDTTYILPGDDRFLLGVLNSRAVAEFYREISAQVRGGYTRYKRIYFEQIPIPDAGPADRKAIGALAQKCLDAKGVGCEAWEKEIDERVETLYGL